MAITSPMNASFTPVPRRLHRFAIAFAVLAVGVCLPPAVTAADGSPATPATIRVDASSDLGPFSQAWAYFGYDACDNTYQPDGRKLLKEIGRLGTQTYVRTHNLLCDTDGVLTRRKGGSNVYREDGNGNPVYNWELLDRIFDSYHEAHVKPLVQIGFMPPALSSHDGQVQYPPKDYARFAELVHRWAMHLVERYGRTEVESWPWQVWNEPNGGYWKGTHEEYFKLYDYAADAVKRAIPKARVGGPSVTGRGQDILREFLAHCAHGPNAVTGRNDVPLDYILFHAKGGPKMQGEGAAAHVRMGLAEQLNAMDRHLAVIAEFPQFKDTPVLMSESDPEGNASRTMIENPSNAYRESPIYGTYVVASFKNSLDLFAARQRPLIGAVTWAFEFENEPYFSGLRELSTHGILKPVFNAFRMLGKMQGQRLEVISTHGVAAPEILQQGVVGRPDISGMASRQGHRVSVLVWNYHDDDVVVPDAPVTLQVDRLPPAVAKVTVRRYQVDRTHSNSYAAWKDMGAPAAPNPEQYTRLQAASELQALGADEEHVVKDGAVQLALSLPREALSLLEITWQ